MNHFFFLQSKTKRQSSYFFNSNFIDDCANGRDEVVCADCTFEQNTCQWEDVSVGTFSWKHDQGVNVGPIHAGPAIDRKFQ